jgi:hypothetical protein
MPSVEEQLAWAAGLFEGEGWFTLSNSYPVAAIRSTDMDVILRFRDIMGHGNVREVNKGPGKKKQWHWQTSGYERVGRFGELIGPWLGERRRKQFERVMKAPGPVPIKVSKNQLDLQLERLRIERVS